MAEVFFTAEAKKELAELPLPIIARMDRLVVRLKAYPDVSGAKPLSGDLAGKYRLRTGDYRMQFSAQKTKKLKKVAKMVKGKRVEVEKWVEGWRVIIEKVGHRDGFYDG